MSHIFSGMKMVKNIGIDLGTANTLVYVDGLGIAVREPSVVAIDKNDGKVLAVGNQANEMLGRTPDNIIAIRPLKDGVIADFDVTQEMVRILLRQACGKKKGIMRPRVTVCVPSGITNVEKRAVEDAVLAAGAKDIIILEEPMAAAIGAGIAVDRPVGHMIVDIGGGTTEVAVVSLSGIVVSKSMRLAGNAIDNAIAGYIKRQYNLTIGDRTAEEIKIEIGSALPYDGEGSYEIKGRDLVMGLPKNIQITAAEVRDAMSDPLREIVSAIVMALEETPPELAGDMLENGILLTGGGALIRNLDRLINVITGLPVAVAENPLDCVALGTVAAGRDENIIKRSGFASRNMM